MIDRFTKQEFEQVLFTFHAGVESLGLEQGEEVFAIPVTESARILVRSSIDPSGIAADTGEDSIRLWIQVYQPNFRSPESRVWQASGKKVDAYTTRVPGWGKRMSDKLAILFERAKKVRRPVLVCPECGKAPWVGFSASDKNPGRPYAKCGSPDMHYFQWLDEPMKAGEIVEFDVPVEELAPRTEQEMDRQADRDYLLEQAKLTPPAPEKPVFRAPAERTPDPIAAVDTRALKATLKAAKQRKVAGEPAVKLADANPPNASQVAAIEAPIDQSTRLMAPPGSGKTYVIERRYAHLVSQGVSPESILVVTYSKKMADEMGKRIKATCPQAYDNQISTIHALCFRILCFWDKDSRYFGWTVAKDWEVKTFIDDLVERYWEIDEFVDEEKPGWKEVMTWIDLSKYHGLTVAQSREFFIKNLGAEYGNWLHLIRRDYDSLMSNSYKLTFADMIFLIERQLIEDAQFRSKWQKRFNHIIVDEAQDTSAQALRVLITLSLAPGKNTVYADWS